MLGHILIETTRIFLCIRARQGLGGNIKPMKICRDALKVGIYANILPRLDLHHCQASLQYAANDIRDVQ